ncbi:hypothetical protein PENTCL1PPCAC_13271, partial [Pristionchus entomophagus]
SSFSCDIREASLVDVALDMQMPATICIRILTKRTGEWALSNSFPEVWTADQIRQAEMTWDNTVVCLVNRAVRTEFVIACRGTHCALPLRKLDAIKYCTTYIDEMILAIDVFFYSGCLVSLISFYLGLRFETRPLPSWTGKGEGSSPFQKVARLFRKKGDEY